MPEASSPHPFLSFLHPAFPERLNQLFDPPCGLYGRGLWPILQRRGPWIGVVGTRSASAYSLKICEELVRAFVPYRAVVVSGMALGIDAMAHVTALQYGLATVGVQGTPLDVIYPRGNADLFQRMAREGLLLSELPPDAPMGAFRFPERNRLIAALCEALVVVEAPPPSGALVTARFALELGREIFVVPGPMDRRNLGAHRFVQQGAHLLTAPEEIFQTLGYRKKISIKEGKKILLDRENCLSEEEKILLELLADGPQPIDKILHSSQIPAPLATSLLTGLAMKGLLAESPGKVYEIIE